jgi:hypothetical protein
VGAPDAGAPRCLRVLLQLLLQSSSATLQVELNAVSKDLVRRAMWCGERPAVRAVLLEFGGASVLSIFTAITVDSDVRASASAVPGIEVPGEEADSDEEAVDFGAKRC